MADMFNTDARNRGNLSGTPIRDNYYDNAPTPAMFTENMKERCLFTNNNNQHQTITQDNNISYDNSNNMDGRGMFIHEQNYIQRPLLDNNMNQEVRNEFIDERDIIIDTIDRDISIYPNIFDFTLRMGRTDTTPGPSIHRSIKNVKYIKLLKTIFPDNYYIKKTDIKTSKVDKLGLIDTFIKGNNANLINTNTALFDSKYELTSVTTGSTTSSYYVLGAAGNTLTGATAGFANLSFAVTGAGTFSVTADTGTEITAALFPVGRVVRIQDTTNYNGYYTVETAGNNTVVILNALSATFSAAGTPVSEAIDTDAKITPYASAVSSSTNAINIIFYKTVGGVFSIDFYCETVAGGIDYSTVYSAEISTSDISSESLSGVASVNITNFYSYTRNQDCQVEKGRFFQLHIDQFPKNNDLATSSNVSNSFALLYPGKEDNRGFNTLDGMETDKIFRFSNLGNFSNLSIKILDCMGDLLTNNSSIWNNNLDNYSNAKNISNVNTSTNSNYRYSFRSARNYLRHPLAWNMQAQFIFTVGEVQIEMNKKTFN